MPAPPLKITVLGSGTSVGVPTIGCHCAVCTSTDPRDNRLRPSIMISYAGRNILIDTTPDFRTQALRAKIDRLDAILFTHAHADHVMGLDDVRRFNLLQDASIPCFGDRRTMQELRRTFAYVFESRDVGGGIPQIQLFPLGGPFTLGRQEIVPVPVVHGSRTIFGFRLGTFAYLTDCNAIPDASWALLQGLDTLVLDALRHRPHPTHFTVAEALGVVERLAPRHAYFTHICHDLPYAATNASLPSGVELAWDGLQCEMW
jgi:phosphoribosyl 1,2-cyclic phosphate phosphodiesterase